MSTVLSEMAGKSLRQLMYQVTGSAAPDRRLTGISLDSRCVHPGYLFLAVRGHREHGLAHLAEARHRGAVAALYEPDPAHPVPQEIGSMPAIAVANLRCLAGPIAARFYDDPSASLAVTGVTGTNGKTSVTTIMAQVLTDWGRPSGLIGTLGYGLPGMLAPASETTPNPVRVQSILAGLRDRGARSVAMEVSSHALSQDRVAGTHFDAAVFTNLTRDHLDYHGSMEAYRQSKQKLFEWEGLRRAVINLDDPQARYFYRATGSGTERIGYSLSQEAPDWFEGRRIYASGMSAELAGIRLDLAGDYGVGILRSRLVGRFSASNLIAVLAVLVSSGLDFDECVARVGHARPVPGRMESFGGGSRPTVVVDYAHTPDALSQALRALRSHAAGKLVVVFGCGGDRDRGKRAEMGRIAAAQADRTILTDDNPRSEDPERIIAEIAVGLRQYGADFHVERDREKAIETAIQGATSGDVILVAGKGHEEVQIVGAQRRRYSDRECVRRLIEGRIL